MNDCSDFNVVPYDLNALMEKTAGTLNSIARIQPWAKVYFAPETLEFVASAAMAQSAADYVKDVPWIGSVMYLTARVCQSVSRTYYGQTCEGTQNALNSVQERITGDLNVIECEIREISSMEEVSKLKEGVSSLREILTQAGVGLDNLVATYRGHGQGAELEAAAKQFSAELEGQFDVTMKALSSRVGQLRDGITLGEIVSASLPEANGVTDDGLTGSSSSSSIPSAVEEGSEEVTMNMSALLIGYRFLTSGERTVLSRFQINEEPLKDLLERLSPEDSYALASFVKHFVLETRGKGWCLPDRHPCARRLRDLRINGSTILEALRKTPGRDLDLLDRFITAHCLEVCPSSVTLVDSYPLLAEVDS